MSVVGFSEKMRIIRNVLGNATTSLLTRRNILGELLDSRRSIDAECGYPESITTDQYRLLYDREGVAKRVVNVYPMECWKKPPVIYETEDPEKTEFEAALEDLQKKRQLLHYMKRADVMSGIGRYGIIVLGLSDGGALETPVPGIGEDGEPSGAPPQDLQLLYMSVYDEKYVEIDTKETDQQNPRYGQPVQYSVTTDNPAAKDSSTTTKIHWTRVIHIADNRETSEIYGVPRQQPVFNRLYDIRKILSGSGEMFWKGAFPGYSFEVAPGIVDASIDTDTLREELDNYANGLQRYLALEGLTAKSLAPQVADPDKHFTTQIQAISIELGVPHRVFMGSEAARLASDQDTRAWNTRLEGRQNEYLTPFVIRPLIDRLLVLGVLPPLQSEEEGYEVVWPDLNTTTDKDKAEVAETRTKALATYVSGGVESLMAPKDYLTQVHEMDEDQVEQIISGAEEFADDMIDEAELEAFRAAQEQQAQEEIDAEE